MNKRISTIVQLRRNNPSNSHPKLPVSGFTLTFSIEWIKQLAYIHCIWLNAISWQLTQWRTLLVLTMFARAEGNLARVDSWRLVRMKTRDYVGSPDWAVLTLLTGWLVGKADCPLPCHALSLGGLGPLKIKQN